MSSWLVVLIVKIVRGLDGRAAAFQETIKVLVLPINIRLGEHLKVGNEVVAGSDVAQDGVYFASVGPRLLEGVSWLPALLTCRRNWLQGNPRILKGRQLCDHFAPLARTFNV